MIKIKCNCFECPLGENSNNILYDIWCDKIGGRCGWYGYCEDAFDEAGLVHKKSNKSSTSKRTRRDSYIKHIENIYSFTRRRWMSPYYEHDGRLIQSNFAWRNKRFYKKYSNKQVRKYNKDIGNGNNYRKVFDYHRRIHEYR